MSMWGRNLSVWHEKISLWIYHFYRNKQLNVLSNCGIYYFLQLIGCVVKMWNLLFSSTHCNLMTPYDVTHVGQRWSGNSFAARGYGSLTWNNDDLFSAGPLTHWGRDNIDAILQTTGLNVFSWMKMYEFRLQFHWSWFLRVQLAIFLHWFW